MTRHLLNWGICVVRIYFVNRLAKIAFLFAFFAVIFAVNLTAQPASQPAPAAAPTVSAATPAEQAGRQLSWRVCRPRLAFRAVRRNRQQSRPFATGLQSLRSEEVEPSGHPNEIRIRGAGWNTARTDALGKPGEPA